MDIPATARVLARGRNCHPHDGCRAGQAALCAWCEEFAVAIESALRAAQAAAQGEEPR